jgi:hypothetical protein
MMAQADNEAMQNRACVECGHVDSPINVGPGPGWLAVILWGVAAAFWILGMMLESLWIGYLAAPVFLGALIYTLWYFYRRERACRHCGAGWAAAETEAGPLIDEPAPPETAVPPRTAEPGGRPEPRGPSDERAGPDSDPP